LNYEYTYTDVSFAFIKKAQTEFSKYNNLKFQVCNIEKDIESPLKNHFDVVVATNVLHATKDIQNTIKNVRALLKSNGIAVINEVTERQDFATLTFGLTTGWWLFEDHRIPDSPLLSPDTWKGLLKSNHFSDIKSHGNNTQQVIVGLAEKWDFAVETIQSSIPTLIIEPLSEKRDQIVSVEPLVSKVEEFIIDAIAHVMKMDKQKISKTTPFAQFGIDSLITLELLKPFKNLFGYVPATIFFEFPNVEMLAQYFVEDHKDVCSRDFGHNISEEYGIISKRETIKSILRKEIAVIMKMDPSTLVSNVAFKNYGIDSLISLEIMKPLNKIFGYLPTTLLFECPTLNDLTEYVLNNTNWIQPSQLPQQIIEESDQQTRVKNVSEAPDDIAIIGYSGRFPQAENCDDFWENLKTGRNCIQEIPQERWDHDQFYDPDELKDSHSSYTKFGGFIKNVEFFDHRFFDITPYDAEKIDPQERLFLEETFKAIQDAGYASAQLKGQDIGVFVGVMNGGYGWLGVDSEENSDADSLFWSIANRASFTFDWSGPSMAIDSACSSSLTALHVACQSLKNGDCSMAVVGGVNLIVHPRQYTKLCKMHMLSNGDKCKSFGKEADGFVDGEGIISVLLKPLSKALKDKDRIHGVIKSTNVNAGGYSNGYTSPNPNAQAMLIEKSIKKAGIKTSEIGYIEAHGTGTELGDPIEIRGLSKVFSQSGIKCPIGSVKSNIGHLESAAGLAGVIKVLLQFKHKQIVPTLNATEENPHIRFDKTPFYLNKELTNWNQSPKIASVSSFGAGGANSHVILKEVEDSSLIEPITKNLIIPISAKTTSALLSTLVSLREVIKHDTKPDFYSLCYTLACGRDHYSKRAVFIASSLDELSGGIDRYLEGYTNTQSKTQIHLDNDIALQYTNGENIDWSALYPERKVVSLNLDIFEKFIHWIENPKYGFCIEERYYDQHKVMSKSLLPAAYPLIKACNSLNPNHILKDIMWLKPVRFGKGNKLITEGEDFIFQNKNNETCMTATKIQDSISLIPNLNELLAGKVFNQKVDKTSLYTEFKENGYGYGPLYKRIEHLQYNANSALGIISSYSNQNDRIDVGVLDAALQIAITPSNLSNYKTENKLFVPFQLEKFRLYQTLKTDICFCYAEVIKASREEITTNIYIFDENEVPVAVFEKLVSKSVSENLLHVPRVQEAKIEDPELEFKSYKFI